MRGMLGALFADQPDLLPLLEHDGLISQQLPHELRQRDPVKLYMVGRTGAGKTSLGNRLFGADVLRFGGHLACTDFIGLLRMRSNLHLIDIPGAGSSEAYENWARLALGLHQVDGDPPAETVGVHDFTDARLGASGGIEGVTVRNFPAQEWESRLSGDFAPDVVVYLVAPHMMFLRQDREFLTALLRRHGTRVVIALNSWAGVTTDIHREDAVRSIKSVYNRVFPSGSVRPRCAAINALTGAGVSDLVGEVSWLLAPWGIQALHRALVGDLKGLAVREIFRRYDDAVIRIAARLGIYTIEKCHVDRDLISAAVEGVFRYGVEKVAGYDAWLKTPGKELADAIRILWDEKPGILAGQQSDGSIRHEEVKEVVVGREIYGGVTAIELLAAAGEAAALYCMAAGYRASAAAFTVGARERVRLRLNRERPELERLLRQGSAAEPAITELLRRSAGLAEPGPAPSWVSSIANEPPTSATSPARKDAGHVASAESLTDSGATLDVPGAHAKPSAPGGQPEGSPLSGTQPTAAPTAQRIDKTAGAQIGSGNIQVNHFYSNPAGPMDGPAPGSGSPSRQAPGGQVPGASGDRELAGTAHDLDERYLRAVEQLGSGQEPVRIGALHALSRLGQNNPGLRQTVIKVICAYLRMPYSGPGESPAPDPAVQTSLRKELQVRLTAQNIIADHLRDAPYRSPRGDGLIPGTFWPEIDLVDLRGAYLTDLDLSGCRVSTIECNGTIFAGESIFQGLLCDLAFFQKAAFKGLADFRGAIFANDAWFSWVTFSDDIWFHGDKFFPAARFGGHAGFKEATFDRKARFEQAIFNGSADFEAITCKAGSAAMNLDGCQVSHPEAVNPDESNVSSIWPPGWHIEPGHGDTATLTRRN